MTLMIEGIIYKYTSPSNKVYIGQTIDEKSRRDDFLNIEISYAGEKINNARKKYSPENFQYEIVVKIQAESREDLYSLLDTAEQYYIAKYDSIKNGYNILEGGKASHYVKTQEQIEKHREALLKYYENNSNPNQKKVLQYTKQGNFKKEWDSMTEAAEYYNCDIRSISNCCRGYSKTASGFVWRIKDSDQVPQTIDPISQAKRKRPQPKYGTILQMDLSGNIINEWESPVDAAKALGIKSSSNIIQVCLGNRKTLKGFTWKFK